MGQLIDGKQTAQEAVRATQTEAVRCLVKETSRTRLLASRLPFDSAETRCVLEKSKQLAVAKLMKAAKTQDKVHYPAKRRTTVTVIGKPTSSKKTPPPPTVVAKVMADARVVELDKVVDSCGCRHGDLNAFKSFTRAESAYYGRPNKFLENRICLDCKRAVRDMKSIGRQQKAVVFYCDEGVKGFSAPDEDPMKGALTCNLVLCPQCEAKRRIQFENGDSTSTGVGRNRNRRQAVV